MIRIRNCLSFLSHLKAEKGLVLPFAVLTLGMTHIAMPFSDAAIAKTQRSGLKLLMSESIHSPAFHANAIPIRPRKTDAVATIFPLLDSGKLP